MKNHTFHIIAVVPKLCQAILSCTKRCLFSVLINRGQMWRDFEKLFSHLKQVEPPEGLFEKVISRIQKEQRLLALKRRIVIFSLGLFGSGVAFFPVLKIAQREIRDSSFWQFFSLIFSDFRVLPNYWQNFAMALLERLPVISLVLFLVCLLVFVELLRFLLQDFKKLILIRKEA